MKISIVVERASLLQLRTRLVFEVIENTSAVCVPQLIWQEGAFFSFRRCLVLIFLEDVCRSFVRLLSWLPRVRRYSAVDAFMISCKITVPWVGSCKTLAYWIFSTPVVHHYVLIECYLVGSKHLFVMWWFLAWSGWPSPWWDFVSVPYLRRRPHLGVRWRWSVYGVVHR